MTTATAKPLSEATKSFLSSTGIPFFEPGHPEFPTIRAAFVNPPGIASAIAQPQSEEHVAALVRHCVEHGVEIAVRAGGHDLMGRSTVQDALQIDLRGLNAVRVSSDKKTAVIGGGADAGTVLGELEKADLTAASGAIGTVGWVGWATMGGYGPRTGIYGLGADQIVGARLVTVHGKIVDADKDLLKGLRGGGAGNWGIVVEVTVKVYPLQEVQGGLLMYDSTDIVQTAKQYFSNFQALVDKEVAPPNLYPKPGVVTIPGMGKLFACFFTWTGRQDSTYETWKKKLAGCAPCIQEAINTSTPFGAVSHETASLPSSLYGGPETVSLSRFSDQAVEVLSDAIGKMPTDPGTAIFIHFVGPSSPSVSGSGSDAGEQSVFRNREPHFMVELMGCSISPGEAVEVGSRWAAEATAAMEKVDSVLEGAYLPLIGEMAPELEKVYGVQNLQQLRKLKEIYDPERVFKNAVPRGL